MHSRDPFSRKLLTMGALALSLGASETWAREPYSTGQGPVKNKDLIVDGPLQKKSFAGEEAVSRSIKRVEDFNASENGSCGRWEVPIPVKWAYEQSPSESRKEVFNALRNQRPDADLSPDRKLELVAYQEAVDNLQSELKEKWPAQPSDFFVREMAKLKVKSEGANAESFLSDSKHEFENSNQMAKQLARTEGSYKSPSEIQAILVQAKKRALGIAMKAWFEGKGVQTGESPELDQAAGVNVTGCKISIGSYVGDGEFRSLILSSPMKKGLPDSGEVFPQEADPAR